MKPLLDPTMTSTSMLRTVGDTVQLGCAGTGLPIPNIKWTRLGGAPLPDPINREVYTVCMKRKSMDTSYFVVCNILVC